MSRTIERSGVVEEMGNDVDLYVTIHRSAGCGGKKIGTCVLDGRMGVHPQGMSHQNLVSSNL